MKYTMTWLGRVHNINAYDQPVVYKVHQNCASDSTYFVDIARVKKFILTLLFVYAIHCYPCYKGCFGCKHGNSVVVSKQCSDTRDLCNFFGIGWVTDIRCISFLHCHTQLECGSVKRKCNVCVRHRTLGGEGHFGLFVSFYFLSIDNNWIYIELSISWIER